MTKILNYTGPWWSSGLERQSHDNLGMLKVEGWNPGIAVSFFKLKNCLFGKVEMFKQERINSLKQGVQK